MRTVCGVERGLSYGGDLGDAAVEDIGWSEQGEARMVMVVVVPGEEVLEPRACVERTGEATGIVGLVLERLEVGLAVRVM